MSKDSADTSLLDLLDLSQLNCLNESDEHTLKSILGGKTRSRDSSQYLLSDADEQLVLNITFNQAVRIRSLVIHTANAEEGPKAIKLLVNRPNIGFEDVEDASEGEVAQTLELSEADVREGKPIPLRFVRFQAVNSLHIFVASNQSGADETRIDAVDVFGIPVETSPG
ncbi:PITH domain-containing protein [Schizophyllum amplum]|uniref:PITH domain-containing protein n=1 Tax=Schizophyllum amplum TaxID=97359 RepID=A0A550C3W5_9AGAR|nr:PITH domain-containing protein [Auriculariopsis ampla]